jgi:phosphate transport system permease protein
VVIYIHGYARNRAWVETIRFALDLLWGIPSIVYGIFGFIIMISMGMRASIGAGIITVALLEFPILVRGMDEIMRLVPDALRETSRSLGATRYETVVKVILRQAAPGLFMSVLVAFGRGVGDAASVLFTAGYADRIPHSLSDPAATLPLAIFLQLGIPYPEVQQRAYASALVLTGIILAVSIISKLLMRRSERNRVAG